jgi:hypothetical protein
MATAGPPGVPRTATLQIFEITASHVSKSPKRRPNGKPRKPNYVKVRSSTTIERLLF